MTARKIRQKRETLENKILENNIDKKLNEIESLIDKNNYNDLVKVINLIRNKKPTYAMVILQTLDTISKLNKNNIDYVFYGGIATLLHCLDYTKEKEIMAYWRETEDIDMLVRSYDPLKAIFDKNKYYFSYNSPEEGQLTITENNLLPTVKIEFGENLYLGEGKGRADFTNDFFKNRKEIDFFGLTTKIPDLKTMIDMKKAIQSIRSKKKDMYDWKLLKSVYYNDQNKFLDLIFKPLT